MLDKAQVDRIFQRLYDKLILEIDCVDNGVSNAPSEHMAYYNSTHLASRVARLNPSWNSKPGVSQHGQFKKAMKIAEEEFLWALRGIVLVHLPAFEIVREAWEARHEFHPSGEIMFMDRFCPWKDFAMDLEKEKGKAGELKFMISQDQRGLWKIQTLPAKKGSFDIRTPLHKEWSGLRQAELAAKSGVSDAEFVHRACFIGGAWSKESAIKMAELSIAAAKSA